jgi:alkanesulfonate monooxygenase SsuD/methylene tetrahydromethanopterin reductase-like flavin-dependent oxidoreductase (luciferase family)
MVLNLVDPPTAGKLVGRLRDAARQAGREPPRVALWTPAAIGSTSDGALEQLRRGIVGYLAAPGYAEMFTAAGFGSTVDYAKTGPHPKDLLAAVPAELVEAVGVVGDEAAAKSKVDEYRASGVDDVVLVPASTDGDPYGEATMRAAARW